MIINSINGQSGYDLCLQGYGNIDNMVKFCNDNGVADINYMPLLPTAFYVDDTLIADGRTNNYVYVTGIPSDFLLSEPGETLLSESGDGLIAE